MAKTNAPVYQLKIQLKDVTPPVWRRIQVLGDISLYELHLHILQAMGWSGGHLHEFVIAGGSYGEEMDDDVEMIDDGKVKLCKII